MRPFSRARLAFVLVALATAGCGPAGGRPVALFGEPGGKQLLTIKVSNNNFNDATLHALLEGGVRRRLGTVTGKGTGSFTLEWTNTAPLQIEIDFLAGSKCTTQAINAQPGDALDLMIGVSGSSDCSTSR